MKKDDVFSSRCFGLIRDFKIFDAIVNENAT